MKIILSGALGKMGKALMQVIAEDAECVISAGFDKSDGIVENIPICSQIQKLPVDADCTIDFSSPEGMKEIVKFCMERRIPFVSGTTGISSEGMSILKELGEVVPVFYATNMSIAIGFLGKVVHDAAKIFSDADAEIIEFHHRHKEDAPSGTALTLAYKIMIAREWDRDSIVYGRQGRIGPRPEKQIAIHAVRAGEIIGEHHVLFAMPEEEILLIHKAKDRKLFAKGALFAAKWLARQKTGLYFIENLIESIAIAGGKE